MQAGQPHLWDELVLCSPSARREPREVEDFLMAIITISRGSFSGGKAVAERLGRRLGQPILSREDAIARAAEYFGIQESDLKATLSKSPPFWQQMPGKRLAYIKCITAVLLDCAGRGILSTTVVSVTYCWPASRTCCGFV